MAGPAVPISQALSAKAGPAMPQGIPMPSAAMFQAVDPSTLPVAGSPGPAATPSQGMPVGSLPIPISGGTGGTPPDQNAPDPISWVFDMLSRPLRAVEQTASGVSDLALDSISNAKGQARVGADLGEIASAPFRGLFSTNANDQQTGSQLIERAADRYGSTNDPHYKDTTNNVAPVIKAAGGLIADLGLDPLSYLGGPEIRAALDGGKALLVKGARAVKDITPPGATGAAKLADAAVGGDAKAADTLDSVATGAANDAVRSADAPEPFVSKVTQFTDAKLPEAKPAAPAAEVPLSADLGKRAQIDDLNKQIDDLNKVDSSKMSPQEQATFHTKLNTLTDERDRLTGATAPEVPTPLTAEGQAAVLTGTDTAVPSTTPSIWTPEQEAKLTRAQARLDKMAPGAAADKLQAQVEAMAAEKAAVHLPAPEAASVPESPAPVPSVDKPVEKPLIPALAQEPQSLGDALRTSRTGQNFVKAYDAAQAIQAKQDVSMLEAIAQVRQKKGLANLLSDQFVQGMSKYSGSPKSQARFARMLDETYRIITKGGHLDNGDFETNLPGARTMVSNLLRDSNIPVEKIQTKRAEFLARSQVPEKVNLESTLERMHGGPNTTAGLVKQIREADLRQYVKESLDDLREDKPGMTNRTRSGAMSTGKDTRKSKAEYRSRLGTHNQVQNLVRGSRLGAERMKDFEDLGGAARSAALRNIVMGNSQKAGFFDSLTRILDEHGASHWLEDGQGRAIPMGLQQGIEILAGDPQGQRLIDKILFNAATPGSKTNLAEAIVGGASGDSYEQVLATLKNMSKRYRDGEQPNFFGAGKEEELVDHRLPPQDGSKIVAGPGERLVNNYDNNGKLIGVHVYQSADSLAEQTADLIVRRRADLTGQVGKNTEAYADRFATESRDITAAGQAYIDALRSDPTKLSDVVDMLAHPKKLADIIGEQAGARADSKEMAGVALEASTPEPDLVAAQQVVKSVAAVKKGDLPAAKAASQVRSDAAAEPVEQAYEQTTAQAVLDGAVADTAGIGPKLADVPPEAVAGETPIGQPAEDVEEVFRGGRFASKTISADERMVAGEVAIHGRIVQRAFLKFPSALGLLNKAADMVLNGFSYESLDTEMRGQLAKLSNKYAGLLQELHKIDGQLTDKLKISDVVRQDAIAGRASAPEYAAQREITDKIISHWMNAGSRTDPNAMLAEPFLRDGASPEAIIKHLKSSGVIPEEFKLDQEEMRNLIEGDRAQYGSFAGSLANLLMQKGVRIPDTYDFYTKMFGATATYATHAGIAEDLYRTGIKQGFLSVEKAPTMRRVEVTNDSIFGHFITEKHVYATPEMHAAILRMSDLLDPKSRASGEVAKMLQVFDDAQQLWKWGEVAIRPGTRVHNYISDHIMTWLAMGHGGFRNAYAQSLKVMAANRAAGGLSTDELVQAIQRVGGDVKNRSFGGSTENIVSGKHGAFTNEQVWRLFENKSGLAVSAKAIERTDKENLSVVGRGAQHVYNSPVGRFASKLTESTENQVRLTHYLMGLQRALDTGHVVTRWGKKVSVLGKNGQVDEELLGHALGDSVRRYHPDPHMLTNFERTTIRRILPFYSWNRGAVPAILDAMFMHPGRGLALNKLSFAVGQSLGVEGNNLADPFPNGMWPSFLTGQAQGPQANIDGSMFMANPGIPTWDVANMFTDPNAVSGSVSPLIALPYTLLSGKDFRTGQTITNPYDALDQQLPIVANVEGGTGTSVTGSLVGLLTGNGMQKTSAGAQQQIEGGQGGIALLNYLTGLQLNHANKASYLQAGVAQQQQRLSNIMSGVSPSLGAGG